MRLLTEHDDLDLGRSGCWTFDPAREVWSAKTGPNKWTEVPGDLASPPPTYEVTVTIPGRPVRVVAECPSGWHATQVATTLRRRGVITVRRDDGKAVFS